ncbi:MAG: hypothetical protein IT165_28855 [Bryobacterales bacterium]|nr:hypothetical protein [Bryobacterales bacterium]
MICLLMLMLAAAESPVREEIVRKARTPHVPPYTVGAALDGGGVLTWGEGLWRVSLARRRPVRLSTSRFSAAGCLYDINADGQPDLLLNRAMGFWSGFPVRRSSGRLWASHSITLRMRRTR